ncbi:hypothetical protein E1265_14695 [Streptomyces sp. 8K308]|uniref:hypothetical protein n=1 Tax=Streptomyces sp. 8K308 TaxID=2530388 RepID=UPI001045E78F|nr:hypothetical protein [Streptomyces sp. 8K308]TDC22804.1 hypothetical protein E1265_14695 [Streptomyces sp. 8K308]
MPSLNISFTEEEMDAVRAAALADGKSLKQYVHDLPLRELHRRQFVRYAVAWGEQHQSEFDGAFPDETPPARHERGVEAA